MVIVACVLLSTASAVDLNIRADGGVGYAHWDNWSGISRGLDLEPGVSYEGLELGLDMFYALDTVELNEQIGDTGYTTTWRSFSTLDAMVKARLAIFEFVPATAIAPVPQVIR